jgi:hypothetical protein
MTQSGSPAGGGALRPSSGTIGAIHRSSCSRVTVDDSYLVQRRARAVTVVVRGVGTTPLSLDVVGSSFRCTSGSKNKSLSPLACSSRSSPASIATRGGGLTQPRRCSWF